MFQPTALYIGLRYSRARQGSAFTAFINRFALIGIAIGVFALVVMMSVMNGFEQQLKQRILGVVPQVTISTATQRLDDWQQLRQQLPANRHIQAATPLVSAQGVVQHGDRLQAVAINGIYPDLQNADPIVADAMVGGRIDNLKTGAYGIVMGRPLARRMNLKLGDEVRLIAAAGGVYTPLGMMPAQRRFTLVGWFELDAEVDTQLVLLHGDDSARLFRMAPGQVSSLRLFLDDAFQAPALAAQLRQQLGAEYQVADWRQRYGRLFDAVGMEKRMIWLMLALIIAVAAFNVVSALVMVINDKRQDIAILQTMGMPPAQLRRLFLVQGAFNGVVGTLLGLVLGLITVIWLNDILAALGIEVIQGSQQPLPIKVEPLQILLICAGAVLLTLLATLYPAARAARIKPSEALRYD